MHQIQLTHHYFKHRIYKRNYCDLTGDGGGDSVVNNANTSLTVNANDSDV